ncbi:GSCFA domain-containing protein [Paucihalobacter sp.]|uniref:GSCFA domain-containing protein n=1 Tax=Paucihalobacter sp. TaxID=2850405 RepID=UPI002FE35468
MQLSTKIPIQAGNKPIDYQSDVVLLGSCFAENMGSKFEYFKFKNFQNPFGILFHPLVIERLVVNALDKKEYTSSDIFFHQDLWHSFDTHSKLSNASPDALIQTLNTQLEATFAQLHKASHIIITLGTAWVYEALASGRYVANCHKVAQKEFQKKLLSVLDIETSLQHIIAQIQNINRKATIIFTISPVRHIKDGFVENTLSKSHLFTALHAVISRSSNCHYFPSYEIMMDELRDYRFYSRDMIHPNDLAVDYIWKRFWEAWISKDVETLMARVETVQKGLQHKAFQPNSDAYGKFKTHLEEEQLQLKQIVSHISF